MLRKLLASMAIVGLLATSTAFASVGDQGTGAQNEPVDYISSFEADPTTFNPTDEDTTIGFDVELDCDVRLYVTNESNEIVRTLTGSSYVPMAPFHYEYTWLGVNDDGVVQPDGDYSIKIFAAFDGFIKDLDKIDVTLDSNSNPGPQEDGVIQDFEIDPDDEWDPADEDLEIEFELEEDVDLLLVWAEKGNKEVELIDDDYADDGQYEEEWDGTDDDGDAISEGDWTIYVYADVDEDVDGDEYQTSATVEVKYEEAEIEAFVTKESFDPDLDEFTSLVFKVDAESVVTVEINLDGDDEFELVEDFEVDKNKWYSIEWDGTDDDGDEVDYEEDWSFFITAENPVDDDVFTTLEIDIDVEEDEVSNKKVNVTNDFTDPIVFDDDNYNSMTISYCLDDDAEIFLAIYEGNPSGKAEIELLDYVDHEEGCYEIEWNGEDDDEKDLKKGKYSYKLISKDGSYKDTEYGYFVVGNEGGDNPGPNPDPNPNPNAGVCADYYWDLNYLNDDNELCQAIAWATEEGIFHGYSDGSFKPYQNINRAEVLKVVLELHEVSLFPINGSSEGFSDVDPFEWYMPYVRTAKHYGMLEGYSDGTARLENYINRVEMLKFVLEASESFTGYETATGYYSGYYADVQSYDANMAWFLDYAATSYEYDLYNTATVGGQEYLKPAQLVERGEVALLFFRMDKAGLLD